MTPLVATHRPAIVDLCRRFHVRRLDIFGSAAREADFDPDHSDVDFLIEFEVDYPLSGLDAYFGLKDALEALLGRKVDLVAASRVQNPYLRRSIDESRENVFSA